VRRGHAAVNGSGHIGGLKMRALVIIFASLFVLARPAHALDITSCGETVPANTIAKLVNDLDCTGEPLGVGLEKDASLDLNGFTMGGGTNIGVSCRSRRCTIVGPGVIDGDWVAVNLESKVRLDIRHVTMFNADVAILGRAVQSDPNRIDIDDVTIDGTYNWAISGNRIRAQRLTITGSGFASIGVVLATRLVGAGIDVSNNYDIGISARKIRVANLTANNNEGVGIDASRCVLVDSEVTGNAAAGSGVDIDCGTQPKLTNTTCGLSSGNESGDWDVCTND